MMPRHAAGRDENEPAIVEALRAAGASVTQLNGRGIPDLLVGYKGATFLLEVKKVSSTGKTIRQTSNGNRPDDRGLTKPQQDWWAVWRGAPPIIVRNPEEALRAIGALPTGEAA